MPKRFQAACYVALPVAIILAAVRCAALPQVVSSVGDGGLSVGLLTVTGIALAALMALSFGNGVPARVIGGGAFWGMAAGVLITGGDMLVSSLWALYRWMGTRALPFPAQVFPTAVDAVLLYALVITGAVGGLFFLLTGVRWLFRRRTVRGIHRVMALAPVLWVWVRVIRFELSFVSSLNLHRSVYELLMLVFEMIFLLWFARFVSGVEEETPRGFVGVALITGVLTAMACLTRLGMALLQNEAAFEACGLTAAADLGICVLAFSAAFGRVFPKKVFEEEPAEEPPAEEPEPNIMEIIMRDLERPDTPEEGDDEAIEPLLRVDTLPTVSLDPDKR